MTCQVSWATQVGSAMLAVETGYGMYEAAPRILNGTASVWDYVAFLPAGGYILGSLNRACFVAETEIATGWGSVTDASLTVAVPEADSGPQAVLSQSWSVEWILLGTGIVMLTAIYRTKRDNQETADLDRFFEELTPDDLARGRHATLPPPDPILTNEQPDPLEADNTAWIQHELSGTALAAGSADHRSGMTPVAAIRLNSIASAARSASRRRTADPAWQMSPWMTTVALLLVLGCFWLAIPSNSRTGAGAAASRMADRDTAPIGERQGSRCTQGSGIRCGSGQSEFRVLWRRPSDRNGSLPTRADRHYYHRNSPGMRGLHRSAIPLASLQFSTTRPRTLSDDSNFAPRPVAASPGETAHRGIPSQRRPRLDCRFLWLHGLWATDQSGWHQVAELSYIRYETKGPCCRTPKSSGQPTCIQSQNLAYSPHQPTRHPAWPAPRNWNLCCHHR